MKLYITEYRTREGVHKTTQHHTPQPTEHIIGDYIEITRPVKIEGCCHKCGEERVDFVKHEYEIVEVRQYVEKGVDPLKMEWIIGLMGKRYNHV